MICLVLMMVMLSGCTAEVYETMGNVVHVGQMEAAMRQIVLEFPEEATVLTGSGTDVIYTCHDYTMSLHNFPSGNIAETIRVLCGYDVQQLTVIETSCGDHKRYEWVWVAAGEAGDVLCRGAVLDDGNYHYGLCVSAEAEQAAALREEWSNLFASFCLSAGEEV